jgi:aminoglycoside phosphotransferase (APT) family kinase protein
MTRRRSRYNYGDLRHLIQRSLQARSGSAARVEGKIERMPRGLWHENYWFWVQERSPSGARAEQGYVLRLLEQRHNWQAGPEPHERLLREGQTLQGLKRADFPLATPEFICFVVDDESQVIGMIETAVPGSSLDAFKDRSTLRSIGRAAANVHRMAVGEFHHLASSVDRAQHVQARLAELDEALFAEFPSAREIREWIQGHLPSGGGTCLLHGDLLPQNLLWNWEESSRDEPLIGIVDWEMACIGDPAYDLAIVSRGNRNVHGVKEGLEILVEEYLTHGGRPIELTDVRVHELLLIFGWLEESWREHQKPDASGHGPDFYENQLQSLFRRTAR